MVKYAVIDKANRGRVVVPFEREAGPFTEGDRLIYVGPKDQAHAIAEDGFHQQYPTLPTLADCESLAEMELLKMCKERHRDDGHIKGYLMDLKHATDRWLDNLELEP